MNEVKCLTITRYDPLILITNVFFLPQRIEVLIQMY